MCGKISSFQNLSCFYTLAEQIPKNLVIHCHPITDRTLLSVRQSIDIFGRYRRAHHQNSVFFNQKVQIKQCCLQHDRENLFQELTVTSIFIMGPEMCTQPCRSHHPVSRRNTDILRSGITEGICVMMHRPSPAAIHFSGSLPAVLYKSRDEIKQGFMTLGQPTYLRRPVIHLCINIHCVFRVPWWEIFLVPDSLQIGRKTSFPAACNQQISSIIKQ